MQNLLDRLEAYKIDTQIVDKEEYYRGRVHGDIESLVVSVIGMGGGALSAGGGTAITVGSGGTEALVGVPLAIGGVVVLGYSTAAGVASAQNMAGDWGKYQEEKAKADTKTSIHEVTDSFGNIIHRDFDAVRISSGQLILKRKRKLMENELIYVLNYLIDRILAKTISMDELGKIIVKELDSREIWEIDNLLITDCYYTLKHIEEEQIFVKEWIYFQECFMKKREYRLEDKFQFVSEK